MVVVGVGTRITIEMLTYHRRSPRENENK